MVQKGRYIVDSVKLETADTVSFVLTGDAMTFSCGQFLMLDYPATLAQKKNKDGSFVESGVVKRAYSIASSSIRGKKGEIELCVKAMPEGWISQLLLNVEKGQEFDIAGPFGKFIFDPTTHKDIVMLAAGSGIAPMHAFCEEIAVGNHTDVRATLLFSNKTQKDIIYKSAFDQFAQDVDGIFVHYTLTREDENSSWEGLRGRVSKDMICQTLDGTQQVALKGRMFYLCGPNVFVKSMRGILEELGVSKDQIHFESYG